MDSALAQTAQTIAGGAGSAAAKGVPPVSPLGGYSFFMPFLAIVALFYVLMILPQKKEQQKRDELLKAIQRGDRVLTRGGLYGTVADIKENVLILKISENSKVEVDRSYVETVQKPS